MTEKLVFTCSGQRLWSQSTARSNENTEMIMRIYKPVIAASCVALAGCWTEGDDETAQNVEAAFENTAEQYEQAAGNASGAEEERLEDTAEVYREAGEAAAEAVDDTDLQGNVR